MRIQIRIQQLKLMRIHVDPDPKPWQKDPHFVIASFTSERTKTSASGITMTPLFYLTTMPSYACRDLTTVNPHLLSTWVPGTCAL
jgi:hypothetical protein